MDVRDKNKTIGLSDSVARLWYSDWPETLV
jgi:hypothetical protein